MKIEDIINSIKMIQTLLDKKEKILAIRIIEIIYEINLKEAKRLVETIENK